MRGPIPINLAVEDELSEQMLRVLLQKCGNAYEVGAVYRKGGNNYLKSKLSGFNRAARGMPYLILTDLDDKPCAADLIEEWFACKIKDYPTRRNHNLLFFIAVREVEAWLLADRESFAAFLRIKLDEIPLEPDRIADPKKELLELVRKTKNRRLREDIVPRDTSATRIGPDYNGRLTEFLLHKWRLDAAEARSPSLLRAKKILKSFLPKSESKKRAQQ
ncbi:MAG: hypothetical protein ABSA12_05540 [Verrucomicrobiia bacterium]|jgi:hypothetical protein